MDVTFPPTMPYSEEDKNVIKHYRERYGWGSLKIFNELGQDPGKNWTRNGISYLILKIEIVQGALLVLINQTNDVK